MKLSFSTLGCPDWSLEQIAENGRKFGFQGVELRTHTDNNHFHPDASVEESRRVAKLFRDAGVPVVSVMAYTRFAFTDPAEVAKMQELMRKHIRIAEAMQAPFIRTFAGQVPKGSSLEAMLPVVGDALKPLAEEAAAKGVRIGLETHDDWCAGKTCVQLLKRIGNEKGFGIVYDIFNAFTSGLESWEETYNVVRPYIIYCHLKDAWHSADGKHHYVPVGAGDLPLEKILRRFKQDGFNSYFSFEWEKKWHPELEAPERVFPHYTHKVPQLWNSL